MHCAGFRHQQLITEGMALESGIGNAHKTACSQVCLNAEPEGIGSARKWQETTLDPWVVSTVHRLGGRFLTSSSLHACNMILFGCPGVIPEWPLDQSYETA